MLANVPPLKSMAEVDAWMAANRTHRAKPLPGLLDNAPTFADMAELDAWIESCKKPTRNREPGALTEEQWQQDRADGISAGTGHWPRP